MPTSIAPTSAAGAANEFLHLAWAEPSVPPVTQMKLQKLLFYAHAWHLAIFEKPLFDEDFEAWAWGPVVRGVYFDTRAFGKEPVSKLVTKLEVPPNGNLMDARFETPTVTDGDAKALIKAVWDSHKRLTAVQLSNSTHAPGEPWTIIRDHYGSLDTKPTIPNELIAQVFKRKKENAAAAAANPAA